MNIFDGIEIAALKREIEELSEKLAIVRERYPGLHWRSSAIVNGIRYRKRLLNGDYSRAYKRKHNRA